MSISPDSFLQVDPVLSALSEAAGGIQKEGPGRWSFLAGADRSIKVTARVDPGWVLMDTSLTACEWSRWYQPRQLWALLQANAGLCGGAKFAVAGNPRAVRVRAEIPVEEGIDPKDRIRNACRGLDEALECVRGTKAGQSVARADHSDPADPGPSEADLQAMCTEAGWSFSERTDGVVAVPLEVEDGYYQATVRGNRSGSLSVWAEIASQDSWPKESWKALGAFLLQACGNLKTVRAAIRHPDSDAATAGFEVVLDPPAGSAELGRAFSALSVACNLTRKEVRALREEAVGKDYLVTVRGWSSRSGQSSTNRAPSGAEERGKT